MNASKRLVLVAALAAAGLSGCVVVPVASDGTPVYPVAVAPDGSPVYPVAAPVYPAVAVPVPTVTPTGAPVPGRSSQRAPVPQSVSPPSARDLSPPAGAAQPASLQARLYPSNEVATETGMLSGTVTNMMSGKGFFQLNYKGEILSGEATRVPGDERRGLANAYGQRGMFMTCDYRMTTPYLGTGTCSLSNGAQYQVHIGG
jgi:hypothetical protein